MVSVGATTGNIRWLDNSTATGGYTEPTDSFLNFNALGNFTYFSARGPSRDGRALPHVGAPGMYVISAASEFGGLPATALVFNPTTPGVATGVQHAVFSGTSMATPNVTGATLLILQSDPKNFPRPLIRNSAAQDDLTTENTAKTGVPVQGWNGAGKMDAVNALTLLKGDATPPVLSTVMVSNATPTAGTPITLTATATATAPAVIDEYLWDIDGDGFTDFFTNKTQTTPNVLQFTTPDMDGAFNANVIAVDSYGRTAAKTVTYTVSGSFDAGTPDTGAPLCIPQPDAGPDSGGPDAATDGGGSADGGHDSGAPGDAGHLDSGVPLSDAGKDAGGAASSKSSGCGCKVAPSGDDATGIAASLAGAFFLGLRLRRRRAR